MKTPTSKFFKALAHSTRREMIELVKKRKAQNLTQMKKHLKVSIPTIKQHLYVLEESGIFKSDRIEGNRVYFFDSAYFLQKMKRYSIEIG